MRKILSCMTTNFKLTMCEKKILSFVRERLLSCVTEKNFKLSDRKTFKLCEKKFYAVVLQFVLLGSGYFS